MTSNVQYFKAKLNDIKIKVTDKRGGKFQYKGEFQGKPFQVSSRLINSLASRFKVNTAVFTYFTPEEYFARITEHLKGDTEVRIAIEVKENGEFGNMLAVSSIDRKIVTYEEIQHFMNETGGRNVEYINGRVEGMYTPPSGEADFEVGGEKFNHQFLLSVPVDGYGSESIALAMLRQICSNGVVAMDSAFRSPIRLGNKDPLHGLQRAVESYANEAGYMALAERLETAQKTPASVAEISTVYNILERVGFKAGTGGVLSQFLKLAGSLCQHYGLVSFDELTARNQSLLPSRISVADVINFVTELATHRSDAQAAQRLHGLVGSILSSEYHLEGSDHTFDEMPGTFIITEEDVKNKKLK